MVNDERVAHAGTSSEPVVGSLVAHDSLTYRPEARRVGPCSGLAPAAWEEAPEGRREKPAPSGLTSRRLSQTMALSERAGRSRGLSVLRLGAAAVPELEFRYLGRMLLHAALVGALTGLVGSLFFVALEIVQTFFL